tara:strand:+ start:254 stop:1390 length:1137 start_codon:yes stop_codon:yes gene_type:complete
MPLVFKKGKIQGYRKPEKKLSKSQELRRRNASYGSGGKFENNFVRSGLGGAGNRVDKARDERQLRNLREFPEVQSDRFRNVDKNIRDAASNEGFNFDNLFMGTNLDRKNPVTRKPGTFSPLTKGRILRGGATDEVRLDQSNDSSTVNIANEITPKMVANALGVEGVAEGDTSFNRSLLSSVLTPAAEFGNSFLGSYIDPNRFNAFRTNEAYSTPNRPGGFGGLLYDALGGTTVDEVMSTYPNNMPIDRPRGNFNNLPPTERSISGGLLGTPTFNFDVAPFGGTGFYDNIMLEAIQDSPFGSGITLNPNLTPSTASIGFLGRNAASPTGTINIGNLGTVTDELGRELVGQERVNFINNEFSKLQNENTALSNLGLNILR